LHVPCRHGNFSNISQLQSRGKQIRRAILEATIPVDIASQIQAAYRSINKGMEPPVDVAVRSATAEVLPGASFAGQQETYLNVVSEATLLDTCRRCDALLFTAMGISCREDQSFDHFDVALSIAVQLMVRSDLGTFGIMFSSDTQTGFPDTVLITATYWIGRKCYSGSCESRRV
jgi:pyruvate,water dikinase